ncbi:MAG: hypothetical protein HY822_07895 [Acidobacteria bacterium]|nr:hypothetical protein [Acidobacteriota bacterium]
MIKLTVEKYELQKPSWSAAEANAGDELTLQVEAPWVTAPQVVEFRIFENQELIDVAQAKPGKTWVYWTAPNLLGKHVLQFEAVVRDKPKSANGHLGVVAILGARSPNLTLKGCNVTITAVNAAFVPKQEKFMVNYRVDDAGESAEAGRFEIWGERYPGKPSEPLYYEKFSPNKNAAAQWNTWDGEAEAGLLDDKYITPEFSPYRLRIIVGPDSGSVKDPYGEGAGKVAIAEAPFEVAIQSVRIRVQQNLEESTGEERYKLASALKVEPAGADGDFPANQSGRLPAASEHGRIRIPMARHYRSGEALDQGGLLITNDYLEANGAPPAGPGGAGRTKHAIDAAYYSRPEIPIEVELRLRSQVQAKNTDPATLGLFEPEAVGPARVEPLADDFWNANLVGARAGGGLNPRQIYWRNAVLKVKRGAHNAPANDGANPQFPYWQACFEITNIAVQDYDVSAFDPTFGYVRGNNELSVYLNRTKLVLSARTDDNELNDETRDYRELPPAAGVAAASQIRLRPGLARAGDVLWITRIDSAAAAADQVANWNRYPPGINCHAHYGGIRGSGPNHLFRSDYSAAGAGTEPIVGKADSFPFAEWVVLRPDAAADPDQERVETIAMLSGDKRGLAGFLFSPSFIAGDGYVLRAWVEREAYHRGFGFIDETPRREAATGDLTVWRWMEIAGSYRLPDPGTQGLPAGVGCPAEAAVGTAARRYRGDGVNMDMTAMNALLQLAFNEWTVPVPPAGKDCHKDADLDKYRTAHNTAENTWPGRVPLNNSAAITNCFVQWDSYREQLPAGIPANRVNVATNTIRALPVGTLTAAAGAVVAAAIQGHDLTHAGGAAAADQALPAGVAAIPRYTAGAYSDWVEGWWDQAAYAILDALTPPNAEPRTMNVVRWPSYHEPGYWIGYNAGFYAPQFSNVDTAGFCKGSGQSFFRTAVIGNTFAHEMGHSVHLVHFVSGNFAWKHHDLNQDACLMSYTFTSGAILRPAGPPAPVAAAGAGARDTGWPDVVPAPLPNPFQAAAGAVNPNPCILFQAPRVVGDPCAKCMLKLRGWREDVLPCAWQHPDLF